MKVRFAAMLPARGERILADAFQGFGRLVRQLLLGKILEELLDGPDRGAA